MISIPADALGRVVAEIFSLAGSDASESAAVARCLVGANLAGHDSHGVVRVPQYVEHVRAGRMMANQHAKLVIDTAVIAVVDGQYGFGQVVGGEAMEIGIEKARRSGVGVVALRCAGHLGRIGEWAEQCAAAGFASIHFTNVVGGSGIVAPFGGADGRLSTNPFTAGMPRADGRHLILDFATSKLAEGKVRVALNKGIAVPEGSLIDAKGKPTRDPRTLYQEPRGALTPMGEHKGYGLAVFCDLLAGLMTGGGCNRPGDAHGGKLINNMLSIVLHPAPATDRASAQEELERFVQWVTGSPPAADGKPVLMPGDPERINRAERLRDGVPLDPRTWASIVESGVALGMDRAVAERAVARN